MSLNTFEMLTPLLYLCTLAIAASVPISPCNIENNECITNIAKLVYDTSVRGVPDLGIESGDPMYQERIGANLPTIKFTLTNSTITGFKKCEVKNVKVEKKGEESTMFINMWCPHFHLHGQYNIDGSLLDLPVKGNGDYEVDITDYDVKIIGHMKSFIENTKRYIYFDDYTTEGELVGKMKLELHNLFDGDQSKSGPVHKFFNENDKLSAKLLAGPVLQQNVGRLVDGFNKQLKAVPIESLSKS